MANLLYDITHTHVCLETVLPGSPERNFPKRFQTFPPRSTKENVHVCEQMVNENTAPTHCSRGKRSSIFFVVVVKSYRKTGKDTHTLFNPLVHSLNGRRAMPDPS